jgi:hypothetical protein
MADQTVRISGATAPPLPGFIGSPFSPLVAAVAERCLRQHFGEPPLDQTTGDRTALVLASVRGDVPMARTIASTVDSEARMSPLLCFQSVANAVLGRVAKRWGIGGPMVCVSPVGDPLRDATQLSADLIGGGEADLALVLVVEPAWLPGERDHATATLLTADRKE